MQQPNILLLMKTPGRFNITCAASNFEIYLIDLSGKTAMVMIHSCLHIL